MFFLFLEKADKGKCPFMAKELKMMTASEEPAQGETTSVGTEGKSSENTQLLLVMFNVCSSLYNNFPDKKGTEVIKICCREYVVTPY